MSRKRKRTMPKPGFSCWGHRLEDVVAAGDEIKRLKREYPELDNEFVWLQYEKIGGEILGEFLDTVDPTWREALSENMDLLVTKVEVKYGRDTLSICTLENNRRYNLKGSIKYRWLPGSNPVLQEIDLTDEDDDATDTAMGVLSEVIMTDELLQELIRVQKGLEQDDKNTIYVDIGA